MVHLCCTILVAAPTGECGAHGPWNLDSTRLEERFFVIASLGAGDVEKGSCVDRGHERHMVRLVKRPIDLALIVYGLVVGILAVEAGAIIGHAARPFGPFAKDISFLTMVTVAVTASLAADSILGWLRRGPRGPNDP